MTHCMNPLCSREATMILTVYGRVVGEVCQICGVWPDVPAASYPTNDRKEDAPRIEPHLPSTDGANGGDRAPGHSGRRPSLPSDFSSWDRDRRQDWLMSIGLDDVVADEAEMDRRIIDYLEDNRG